MFLSEARLWRETKRSKAMEGDKKKQDYGGRQKEARLWRETKRSKAMEGDKKNLPSCHK
jgi:hypothetical protein